MKLSNDLIETDTAGSDGEEDSNEEGLTQAEEFYKGDSEVDCNSNSTSDGSIEDDKPLIAKTIKEKNGKTQEEALKVFGQSLTYNDVPGNNDNCMDEEKQGLAGYVQSLLAQGRVATVKENKQLIKGVLPVLFGACKFLQSDDNLVFNGTISRYFFHHLNIGEDKQEQWWLECKTMSVRQFIVNKQA